MRLLELVCPRCMAMNRPGALIIVPDDPMCLTAGTVSCGVCSYSWRLEEAVLGGDRRRGPADRRVSDGRSNWTSATGRDHDAAR